MPNPELVATDRGAKLASAVGHFFVQLLEVSVQRIGRGLLFWVHGYIYQKNNQTAFALRIRSRYKCVIRCCRVMISNNARRCVVFESTSNK